MRWLGLSRGLLVILIGIGPTVGVAQRSIPPGATRPVAPSGSTVEGQEVEGLVRRIDRAARTITLDNGEEYFVPVSIGDLARVDEGAVVRLRYGTDGGRNVTTHLLIRP
jgi:Protein of unknown function (DUF1344)